MLLGGGRVAEAHLEDQSGATGGGRVAGAHLQDQSVTAGGRGGRGTLRRPVRC